MRHPPLGSRRQLVNALTKVDALLVLPVLPEVALVLEDHVVDVHVDHVVVRHAARRHLIRDWGVEVVVVDGRREERPGPPDARREGRGAEGRGLGGPGGDEGGEGGESRDHGCLEICMDKLERSHTQCQDKNAKGLLKHRDMEHAMYSCT